MARHRDTSDRAARPELGAADWRRHQRRDGETARYSGYRPRAAAVRIRIRTANARTAPNRSVGCGAVITVSTAQPGDVPAIVGLLEELGRYYGVTETETRGRRMGQVSEMLFGSPPTAYVLLARDADGAATRDGDEAADPDRDGPGWEGAGWDGGLVAGMAAYSFLWPTVGTARSLFLKELYVADGYRRRGVGKALMRAVFETATVLG